MRVVNKMLNVIFFVSITLVNLAAFFGMLVISEQKFSYLAVPIVLFFFAVGIVVNILIKRTENFLSDKIKTEKYYNRIFYCFWFGLLVLQILFACMYEPAIINDLKHVCNGAENVVTKGIEHLYDGFIHRHKHYFAVYSTNRFLYCIIYALYKVEYSLFGEIKNILPVAFNIISLNFSYFILYKCAGIIYEGRPAKIITIMIKGLFFTPLVTYVTYFYTDSLAILWIMLGLFFYLLYERECKFEELAVDCKPLKKKYVYVLLDALCIAVGYAVKGTTIILLIAILMNVILVAKKKKNIIVFIIFVTLTFYVANSSINSFSNKMLALDEKEIEEQQFPMIHWIMMSADGQGNFNWEDFFYTKNVIGYENKKEADLKRLKYKLEKQGVSGFVEHIIEKAESPWRDGVFMIPFYVESRFLSGAIFYSVASILYVSILQNAENKAIISLFFKERDDVSNAGNIGFVTKLLLIGIFLFLLIWESKSRYLVSLFLTFVLI